MYKNLSFLQILCLLELQNFFRNTNFFKINIDKNIYKLAYKTNTALHNTQVLKQKCAKIC